MVLVLTVVLMETPEGGWRTPPEVIPAAVPPSDLLRRQPSVSRFLVLYFSAASFWKTWWTIFIVVFRSRGSFGKKNQRKRIHEAQNGGSHAAQESGRVGLAILALGPPLLCLFRSYTSSFLKMIPINFQVIWTSFGSLKLKNIENRVFCQYRVNSRRRKSTFHPRTLREVHFLS